MRPPVKPKAVSQDEDEKAQDNWTPKPKSLEQDANDQNPEERSSIISLLFYSFVSPLIKLGYERTLVADDLWKIAKKDSIKQVESKLDKLWKDQKTKTKPSLFKAMFIYMGKNIFVMLMYQFLAQACQIAQPFMMQRLLVWITNNGPIEEGWLTVTGMFFLAFFATLTEARATFLAVRLQVQLRAGCCAMVFNKALRIHGTSQATDQGDNAKPDGPGNQHDASLGRIVNLMSSDAEHIGKMAYTAAYAFLVPIQVTVIIYFLYDTIGAAAFAGVGVLLLIFPTMGVILMKTVKYQKLRLTFMDKRVKLTNEILQGIRVVKFYAWEHPFLERIKKIRAKELNAVYWVSMWTSNLSGIFVIAPALMVLSSFAVVAYQQQASDPPLVFRAVAFFGALTFPMFRLPSSISDMIVGLISARRIQDFLTKDEIPPLVSDPTLEHPIIVTNATFLYTSIDEMEVEPEEVGGLMVAEKVEDDKEAKQKTEKQNEGFGLRDINFVAEAGRITAVVGPVASGKSSLLNGILGELQLSSGEVGHRGTIAYVAQTAWIQNCTIQENIIFGYAFDQKRYREAIETSALGPDLEIFPAGDHTEIGDRGINLSGGQKQRIALARAIYADADIYLLDDPLSAVDAHVAEHIFSKCLKGVLKSKAVVFVTNQLQFLERCDDIYVLKEGRIDMQGTFKELMGRGVHFNELMESHMSDLQAEENQLEVVSEGGKSHTFSVDKASCSDRKHSQQSEDGDDKDTQIMKGRMVEDEEIFSGSVTSAIYLTYVRAMGGIPFGLLVVLSFSMSQVLITYTNFWLADWTSNSYNQSHEWYIVRFVYFILGSTGFIVVRNLVFCQSVVNASKSLHEDLLFSVARGNSQFFDTTPLGRVLNRFSKDVSNIDSSLPRFLLFTLGMLGSIGLSLGAVVFVSPWFAVAILVAVFAFSQLQKYFKPACIQIQRLESNTRSPIYANFSEVLNGLATIRSFEACGRFKAHNHDIVNVNSGCNISIRFVFQWATVRIGLINAFLTFCVGAFFVAAGGVVDPALAGVSITLVLSIGGIMGFLILLITELENQMNSVERCDYYTNSIIPEAPWVVPEEDAKLPADWPQQGVVEFKNIVMKYRENLDPAVRDVSFKILPKENVGIVGRTGSGKSSSLLALLRMYELDSGSIKVDGFDISKLGLHTLRKKLSIIPQDPVVFSGNVKMNLDPFCEHSDEELWEALEHANLKEFIRSLSGGLEATVTEYGRNFSQGQRQLLCMARALLRQPKILLMDEATSSIDVTTDRVLQVMVRSQFKDATVLTIAHRLNTVMDSSRIAVLEQGEIVEYDAPADLVAKPNGVFARMYAAMTDSGKPK